MWTCIISRELKIIRWNIFFLTPFDIWDCYFKSNLSQLMYIKVFLKKALILFWSLPNRKNLCVCFCVYVLFHWGDIVKKMFKSATLGKKKKDILTVSIMMLSYSSTLTKNEVHITKHLGKIRQRKTFLFLYFLLR